MTEPRNIFVIGLDDFHRRQLETVRGAGNYRFHGLIDYDAIVNPVHYPIEEFLHGARRDLAAFDGTVDAIIGHWDFPTTSLLPILQREHGLRGPRLEAVLRCENKYWTRMEQSKVSPETTPPFARVDPADDAIIDDPPLPYPFWLKPVVAFSSALGFRVNNRTDFVHALERIRPAIGRFAEPFDTMLSHAELGSDRVELTGQHCIAEGIIGGRGCTLEGYVFEGEPHVYAVIDSLRGPNAVSFVGYHYPSDLPEAVIARMEDATRRVVQQVGLDDTPFNVEFFWDEASDDLKLLEINARISKSHSPLFQLVTGSSHHEVAIDVALGRRPAFPRAEGRYAKAAKFMPRVYDDARVTRVPTAADVAELNRRFPEALFECFVQEGKWLSALPDQDSYSYEIGDLFLGADDRETLTERFHEAMGLLEFRFSRDVRTNYDERTLDEGEAGLSRPAAPSA